MRPSTVQNKLLFNAVLYTQYTCRVSRFIGQLIAWGKKYNDHDFCFLVFYIHNKGKSTHTNIMQMRFKTGRNLESNCCHKPILLTLDLMVLCWKNIDLFIQVLEPTILHLGQIALKSMRWIDYLGKYVFKQESLIICPWLVAVSHAWIDCIY